MYTQLLFLSSAALVAALPQQTPAPTKLATGSSTTTPPSSTITSSASLSCSSGSTVLHTTDCTIGVPISYCYSPPPPIQCSSGYYPGVYHPGHCIEASTCYAIDSPWITTTCTNGEQAYATSTLYAGTLAGGQSTVITRKHPSSSISISIHANNLTEVQCSCPTDEWYSWSVGASTEQVYCMPHTSCGVGMTTSTSTNT